MLRATLGFLYLPSSIIMLTLLHQVGRFGVQDLFLGLVLMTGVLIDHLISGAAAPLLDRGYSRIAVLTISTLSVL